MRKLLALACCLLPVALLARQTRDAALPPAGSAVISGLVVTDEAAPAPVRRAIVTVSGGPLQTSRTAITDDAGRFQIANLPAGRVSIAAVKSPFIASAYGAKRPGRPGTPVMLTDGQQLDVTMRLTRGAVLTGVVRGSDGTPVPGVQIRIVDLRNPTGNATAAERTFVTSDDRGVYRLFGLVPGEYVIVANAPRQPGNGEVGHRADADTDALFAQLAQRSRSLTVAPSSGSPAAIPPGGAAPMSPLPAATPVAYAPMYFPGTALYANATRLKLGAGEERGGLDFPVAPVPVAVLEGVVVSGSGQALSTIQISITRDGPRATMAGDSVPVLVTKPGPDGRFKYTNVAPGRYTLVARSSPGTAPDSGSGRVSGLSGAGRAPLTAAPGENLYAAEVVDVDGLPVSGVTLSLVRGSHLSGRLVFTGTALKPPSDLTTFQISISPPGGTNMTVSNGTIMGNTFSSVWPVYAKSDGTFELANIAPGPYRVLCTVPSTLEKGWWLKSAMIDGRDLLDAGFDVSAGVDLAGVVMAFSDQHTELSGVLQNTSGQPAPDYFVITYPADRSLWRSGSRRVLSTRPGTDGAFTIRDLPPGDYLMAAVTDVEPADLNDTAFLDQLVHASVKITLADGEKKIQNVRIAG